MMASKLDSIREKLAEFDRINPPVVESSMDNKDWQMAKSQLAEFAPEALRALLTCVDALATYARDGGKVNAMAMFAAVDALTADGESEGG
jgi:hypothetical protein